MRGSGVSFGVTTRMIRPSSGAALRDAGKETETVAACAAEATIPAARSPVNPATIR